MRDEAEHRKRDTVDSSTVVDLESLEGYPIPPTPTVEALGTSAPTPSTIPPSTSHPPLTHAMLYQMGTLSHLEDVRASRLEATVPSMIKHAIESVLAPIQDDMKGQCELLTAYWLILDTLTARVEERENIKDSYADFTALKDDVIGLREDVDELKSTID